MAILPEVPMVNAGNLYVNGLGLSNNATTPNTLLNIAAGACRDSSNTNDIVVSSAVVLNIAASGALGLDTGTLAANTLYAVYAIGSSTNQIGNGQPVSAYPGTVIMSASFSQPVLPLNYDMFRRIGTVAVDGSSHIRTFVQSGLGSARTIWYGAPIATSITAGAATSYTAVGLNAVNSVVPAQVCNVRLGIVFTPATAGNKVTLQPIGAGASTDYASMSGDVAAVAHNDMLNCVCGVAAGVSNMNYKVSNAGDAVAINVRGFEDNL